MNSCIYIIRSFIYVIYFLCCSSFVKKDKSQVIHISDILRSTQYAIYAPKQLGNFAFPDNSATYFISFLPPNQTFSFFYNQHKKYLIVSATIYNSKGAPIYYYDDASSIEDIYYTTTQYCCCVIRVYSLQPEETFNHFLKKYNINENNLKTRTSGLTSVYGKIMKALD